MDKIKRKLETDLKASQLGLEEIDRIKKDLEEGLKKRDQELKLVTARVEEEQGQASNLMKKLKELQVIILLLVILKYFINVYHFLAKNRRIRRRIRK